MKWSGVRLQWLAGFRQANLSLKLNLKLASITSKAQERSKKKKKTPHTDQDCTHQLAPFPYCSDVARLAGAFVLLYISMRCNNFLDTWPDLSSPSTLPIRTALARSRTYDHIHSAFYAPLLNRFLFIKSRRWLGKTSTTKTFSMT